MESSNCYEQTFVGNREILKTLEVNLEPRGQHTKPEVAQHGTQGPRNIVYDIEILPVGTCVRKRASPTVGRSQRARLTAVDIWSNENDKELWTRSFQMILQTNVNVRTLYFGSYICR